MDSLDIQQIDPVLLTYIKSIGRLADKDGLRAYVVGGFVRDCLIKRKSVDIDIVIEGDAIAVAKAFALKANGKMLVHQHFATAAVTLPNGLIIDFVTSRRETYAKPGVLPKVEPSDLGDDLFRRDFTINAIAVNINKNSFGQFYDPYQGRSDLKQKRLRVMHQDSFVDDPTRILRLVRYASRFNYTIEPETLRLLKKAATDKVWLTVKPQRYFAEFRKVCAERHAMGAFKLLIEYRALGLPLVALRSTDKRLRMISKALANIGKLRIDPTLVWLMGLQDYLRVDDLIFAIGHLGLTREELGALEGFMRVDNVIGALSVKHVAPSKVYRLLRDFDPHVLVMALARSQGIAYDRIKKFIASDMDFELLISGEDFKVLGVKEGDQMKKWINQLKDACLDLHITRKTEQMALAKKMLGV